MRANGSHERRNAVEPRRGANVHNRGRGQQLPVQEATKDSGNMQSSYVKELAIIDYSGKRNPALWENARSKLEVYVSRIYGYECGHLFKTSTMYVYPDLPEIDMQLFTAENDPLGFAKLERSEDIKARKRDIKKFTDNNKLVYTLLKGQCTTAMWNQVKTSEHFNDFDTTLDLRRL